MFTDESSNNRLERAVTGERWRAASALRYVALASLMMRGCPAAQPHR